MKKILFCFLMFCGNAFSQTFPVNNLVVNGTSSFAGAASMASTLGVTGTSTLTGVSNSLGLSNVGPILVGSSSIQATCDPTGVADATSCLNSAIQAAQTVPGGGLLIIPPGTYKVSGTLFQSKASTVMAYGATLVWQGSTPSSCCTPVYKVGNSTATSIGQVQQINLYGLSVNANNVNNLYGIEWDTVRNSHYEDLTVNFVGGSVQGGSGPFAYFVTSTDTGTTVNTSLNTFVNLNGLSNWQGLALSGVGSGGNPTATATDNGFFGVHLFFVTSVGLDLIQYADTNRFYDVGLYAGNTSGTFYGVVFNDGPNSTTQNNDILWEDFDGLTITGGPVGTTSVGLQMNYTYENTIRNLMYTTGGAGGVEVNPNGPASVLSYRIEYQDDPFVTQYVTPPPTAVPGANAGSGAPTPVVASGSTQLAGSLTFGTGAGAGVGALVSVTFPKQLLQTPRSVILNPTGGNSAGLTLFATSISTSGFFIWAPNAPASSEPNSFYGVAYQVNP